MFKADFKVEKVDSDSLEKSSESSNKENLISSKADKERISIPDSVFSLKISNLSKILETSFKVTEFSSEFKRVSKVVT